jgi:hypothetical protein
VTFGVLMGGIVVEHHVDRFVGRHLTFDGIEKADRFLMPVALHTAPDDLAFEDIEGGEQGGGPVALVIVCHRGAAPLLHRQVGLGAVERLDSAFLVDARGEKATAARMVDRMEKKGWVVRRPDAADRRVNRLHLTAEAELLQVQLAEIADRTVDDALALLSARERDQFAEWMRRVKRQLQAMIRPEQAAAANHVVELVK